MTGKKGTAKIEQTKIEQVCMQVKTEMMRKVGKDPGEGSKKCKEVGSKSPLAFMFQKQQTVNDLNKAREAYNAILEKGKQLELDDAAHSEPVLRSENGTHVIVEADTDDTPVDATVPKRSVNPNCRTGHE
jgi:hypothetical protein